MSEVSPESLNNNCFECGGILMRVETDGVEKSIPSCDDCRFYNGDYAVCDWNYRAYAILNERTSAKECDHFEKGEFVYSDEHLLVK
jgi:hypothetical protein